MSVGTAITAAVIGTVGSVASAEIGSHAASSAAKTQATAGTNAAQTFQPYQAGAMNAYNKAAAMFGLPPQPVPGQPGQGQFTGPGTVTGAVPGAPPPRVYAPGTGPTYGLTQGQPAPPQGYSLNSFTPAQGAPPPTASSFGQ